MSRVPFLDLAKAYQELRPQLDKALLRVASSGQYLFGPETESFEREFADYIGTRYAVTVGSGLDALIIALRAYGIGVGDDVLVPTNTFVATWMAVSAVGARPIPVEPDPHTYNIDIKNLNRRLSKNTRAIIPVHLYGRPCDMESVTKWAKDHSLPVIEDAAQSHGAWMQHPLRKTGSLGQAGCWSFYPGKNMGAFGDAGAITTNDERIAERCRELRNYGSVVKYHHETMGVNSRISEMDAAVLRVKLRVLNEWNRRREAVAQQYLDLLSDVPLVLPELPESVKPSWHLFVVQTSERDGLRQFLREHEIDTQIHYPVPPLRQPVYAAQYSPNGCPIAEWLSQRILSLPIGPHMSEAQVRRVSDLVHRYYS